MTDVLVYCPDFQEGEGNFTKAASDLSSAASPSSSQLDPSTLRWHSNHRVFRDLIPGDRLWVVTSGKSLGMDNESAGYVVAVWPVAQVVKNPGDDPQYPARKFEHRVLVNETEAIHLDEPVDVDHVIRGEGYDPRIPVGRFLRGPRRLTDDKVRQLRSAAGAEIAQKWLTASKPANGPGPAADETSPRERQPR
jgi:hypothetical protein